MTGKPASAVPRALPVALAAAVLLVSAGCRQGMYNQYKQKALSESPFYQDGLSARVPPAGTVARGNLREDREYYTGQSADGKFLVNLPASVTFDRRLLLRGQQRFEIFCSPCHGRTGAGNGMIVQRGFKQPTSFHDPRLRTQAIGYFFDVMTQGFNQMSSYASQVPVADRWAIASYIRALQLAQNAPAAELAAADRAELEKAATAKKPESTIRKPEVFK